MRRRHPLPRLWLMTDERQGESLWPALRRLPRGAGIIFRHYATPAARRRALFQRVRRVARARGLVLILADTPRQAVGWRADGCHGRHPTDALPAMLFRTAPAHDRTELVAARRRGVDLVLLSPVFTTRSHPGAAALGPVRFGLIAGSSGLPVIALGGMDDRRFRRLRPLGAHGFAAIDAWSG